MARQLIFAGKLKATSGMVEIQDGEERVVCNMPKGTKFIFQVYDEGKLTAILIRDLKGQVSSPHSER